MHSYWEASPINWVQTFIPWGSGVTWVSIDRRCGCPLIYISYLQRKWVVDLSGKECVDNTISVKRLTRASFGSHSKPVNRVAPGRRRADSAVIMEMRVCLHVYVTRVWASSCAFCVCVSHLHCVRSACCSLPMCSGHTSCAGSLITAW